MREKVRFCVALCCSVVVVLLASCRYSLPDLPAEGMSRKTKDSLTYLSKYHYTWNTNLEVLDDSVRLEYLPLKDAYVNLYKGDRVVVAEFSVHPQDSVDSIWVKVAHSPGFCPKNWSGCKVSTGIEYTFNARALELYTFPSTVTGIGGR